MTNTASACTPAVITRAYKGMTFQFREDGFLNMTNAANHFGKDLPNFMRSPDTIEYLEALERYVKPTDHSTSLVEAKRGWYLNTEVGTWAHPKLAVLFAHWLDVKFSAWCYMTIDDLLCGKGEVTTTTTINSTKDH